METSKKKGLERTTVDMKRFAELRQQYREKKDKTVRQKTVEGEDDSSDDNGTASMWCNGRVTSTLAAPCF